MKVKVLIKEQTEDIEELVKLAESSPSPHVILREQSDRRISLRVNSAKNDITKRPPATTIDKIYALSL